MHFKDSEGILTLKPHVLQPQLTLERILFPMSKFLVIVKTVQDRRHLKDPKIVHLENQTPVTEKDRK